MSKPVFPWGHERRFNSYPEYFRKLFGERVQKVSIDAGFSCPNIDGTKARGGCTYCNNKSFNPSYCSPQKSIRQQIDDGIEFHKFRYRRVKKYLAYFQAFSNTHASINDLKEIYSQAINHPDITGLVIGTRPDCIDDEKLDYFAEIAKQKYIAIEYGIESTNDETLRNINRHHTFEESKLAIQKTASRDIPVGAHLIFGLPGESKQEMLARSTHISSLPLTTVKFHQLQIIKGTKMAKDYEHNPQNYRLFSINEYVDFIVNFAESLNPDIVIERFVSEVPPRFKIAPDWGMMRTDRIQQVIEAEMKQKNTWQGRLYKHVINV
jgi:radical SAM protein (TIGR01212 family)